MLKTLVIRQAEVVVVTLDPLIPLLLGLLIGLLLSVMAGGIWSMYTRPRRMSWLTPHERVMGGLLVLAVFTWGVFITYVLLR